jgi:hypothetical protein
VKLYICCGNKMANKNTENCRSYIKDCTHILQNCASVGVTILSYFLQSTFYGPPGWAESGKP